MAFDITKLTNVTDGGSPDLGDNPTSGLLADLITQIVALSDEIVNSETFLEDSGPNSNEMFNVASDIVLDVNNMIQQLKSRTLLIQSQTYGLYHAPELPAGYEPPYYGFNQWENKRV